MILMVDNNASTRAGLVVNLLASPMRGSGFNPRGVQTYCVWLTSRGKLQANSG